MKGSVMQLLSRLMLGIACAVGAANTGFAADAGSADARLKAIYSTEWKWRERQLPDTEDTQKPIQDHLPKVDPASQAQRLASLCGMNRAGLWITIGSELERQNRSRLRRTITRYALNFSTDSLPARPLDQVVGRYTCTN